MRLRERAISSYFPGALWRLKWLLDDPLAAASPKGRRIAVSRARDEIRKHVLRFVEEHS